MKALSNNSKEQNASKTLENLYNEVKKENSFTLKLKLCYVFNRLVVQFPDQFTPIFLEEIQDWLLISEDKDKCPSKLSFIQKKMFIKTSYPITIDFYLCIQNHLTILGR